MLLSLRCHSQSGRLIHDSTLGFVFFFSASSAFEPLSGLFDHEDERNPPIYLCLAKKKSEQWGGGVRMMRGETGLLCSLQIELVHPNTEGISQNLVRGLKT